MKLLTMAAVGLVLYPWAGAEACGGLQTTVTLPADGASDVPKNTRVFTGGFGPGAFGPGSVGVPLIVPELWGPSGQVSVTVESTGDGRAWWAVLTPTAPLEPASTYEVRSGAHVESLFTTGTGFDAKAPAPVTVTVAADASDPCTQTTCGWSSLLDMTVTPLDPDMLVRVYVRVPPEPTAHVAGVMAAALATRPWGVGTATAYNNAAAFPILQPSTGAMFAEALIGATVCVSVEALDLAGNTSGLSAEACGVLPDPRPEACSAARTPPDAATSTATPSSSTEATLDTTTATTTPAPSGGCTTGRAGPRLGVMLAMLMLIALRRRRAGELVARRVRADALLVRTTSLTLAALLALACGSSADSNPPAAIDGAVMIDDAGVDSNSPAPLDIDQGPGDVTTEASPLDTPDVAPDGDAAIEDTGPWECPTQWPDYGGGEPCQSSCAYGSECCCGACSDSYVCECHDGKFSCHYTDFCLSPMCSPGCDAGLYRTAEGCVPCSKIQAAFKDGIAAEALAAGACNTAADCLAVKPEFACGEACPVAVSSVSTFTTAVSAVSVAQCPDAGWTCGYYEGPCPASTPTCSNGVCSLVPACTVDANCDDKNPCTTDTCDALVGCASAALPGAPCPGKACTLGAHCEATVCVQSGSSGWVKTVPSSTSDSDAVIDAHPGGGFLLGTTVGYGTSARVRRVDATGTVTWAAELVAIAVDDVIGVAGSGGVVASRTIDGANVLALGANGETLWQAKVDGTSDLRHALTPTTGGWALAAPTGKVGEPETLRLVRIDTAGKVLGTTNLDATSAPPILVASEEGCVLAAGILTPAGTGDIKILHTNTAGALVSEKTFTTPSNDGARALLTLDGGDVLLAGGSISYDKESKSGTGWVRRLTAADELVWEVTFPESFPITVDSIGTDLLVVHSAGYGGAAVSGVRLSLDGQALSTTVVPGWALPGGVNSAAGAPGGFALAGWLAGANPPRVWMALVIDDCATGACLVPGCPN